jgi:glycosyltransferase involved in cell wall biosynthesis
MVFDLLTENRELLSRYKIVFVGRDGWNDAKGALLGRLREAGLDTDRVVFAGFVSEDAKLKLLANCSFCIYPSFFEGYGIPVAEAAVLGKYVVCSNSSSLPEVALEMSFFFDPLDVASLSEAVYLAEKASRLTRLNDLSYLDINAKLKQRDWGRAYTMVRDRMLLGAAA